MKQKLNVILIIIFLPLIISVVTHFGYISGYTEGVFSTETFSSQYDSGIYKYRILSKYLLLETDNIMSHTGLNRMDNMLSRNVRFMDSKGTLSFYFSYFIINSVFSILGVWIFYLISIKFFFVGNINKSILAVLFYVLGVSMFQYVLVPYDYTSFFFNNLIIYLFLSQKSQKSILLMSAMLLTIVLATLNRETSALAISFMLALNFTEKKNIFESVKEILLPAAAFLITYFGLRLFLGFDSGFLNKFTLHLNLISPLNLFGIFSGIFSIYLVYYFVGKSDIRKTLTNYLLFSMPYILVSLCGGITYEIRLWTPLIINLVIILLYYRKEF
ncbi:MAG: hypothetical protein RO257_04465 [Candidatus Kapabacteria bacterium]|nr:hypothetical protein [Candidatus Kapabacteria bacterium]